jgi:hypothetical protein
LKRGMSARFGGQLFAQYRVELNVDFQCLMQSTHKYSSEIAILNSV